MIPGLCGIAISTTGHLHRMDLLRRSVTEWVRCAPGGSPVYVTVDGSDEDAARVNQVVFDAVGIFAVVLRVGQPQVGLRWGPDQTRLGVAANKNTGIEELMRAGVEHLFLSDDDCWPLYPQSLDKHIELNRHSISHSMVCWGKHRFEEVITDPDSSVSWARWSWPRGAMLYAHRDVITSVGGMVEEFGPGGHEHVEWSQRIHNALMTLDAFVSPVSYTTRNGMGAAALWHCEDMRRPGEPLGNLRLRRRNLTSVERQPGDWEKIEDVMFRMRGSTDFVPYRAVDNGRASATLCVINPSRGAGEG